MLKNFNTNFNFLNFMLIKINIKIPDKYILLFERTLCVPPSGQRGSKRRTKQMILTAGRLVVAFVRKFSPP